jgi:hypothetical protein
VRTIRRSLALAKFFYQWADERWATSRTPIFAIRLAFAPHETQLSLSSRGLFRPAGQKRIDQLR